MQDIALNFKIGVSTVPFIVHATARILFEELKPRCMKASRPFYVVHFVARSNCASSITKAAVVRCIGVCRGQ